MTVEAAKQDSADVNLTGMESSLSGVGVKTAGAVGVKAVDGEERTFEAIVSVFGNVDYEGETVKAGGFAKALSRDEPIPIVWAHQYDNPESHIGVVIEAKELAAGDPLLPERIRANGGLWVKGKMDDDPRSEKVYGLLKSGRVKEFSFSFNRRNTVHEQVVMPDGQKAVELSDIDLWEVGPVLRGMNPNTELIGVKAATTPSPAASAAFSDRGASATLSMMRLWQTDIHTKSKGES